VAGCDVLDVLRVLPVLELADLVERTDAGWRLTPPPKPAAGAGRG
jgi:DNA processing protein